LGKKLHRLILATPRCERGVERSEIEFSLLCDEPLICLLQMAADLAQRASTSRDVGRFAKLFLSIRSPQPRDGLPALVVVPE
jgi:hypothetical protein